MDIMIQDKDQIIQAIKDVNSDETDPELCFVMAGNIAQARYYADKLGILRHKVRFLTQADMLRGYDKCCMFVAGTAYDNQHYRDNLEYAFAHNYQVFMIDNNMDYLT